MCHLSGEHSPGPLPEIPSLLSTPFQSINCPFLLESFHNAMISRVWVQVACTCMGKGRTFVGTGLVGPSGRAHFQSCGLLVMLSSHFAKEFCLLKKINTAQLPALPLCSKSSWTSQQKNWDCSFDLLRGALSTWIEEPSLGLP